MATQVGGSPRNPVPIVPAGGCFEGLLVFRDGARIEGEVRGRVEGLGCLTLTESATLCGPVSVDELVCTGGIEGDVLVRGRARLDEGATLSGTLRAARLAVADGALIQGRCRIGDASE